MKTTRSPLRSSSARSALLLGVSVLLLCPAGGAAQILSLGPLEPGPNRGLYHDGQYPREFVLVVPPGYDPTERDARPLVSAQHGSGGTVEEYLVGAFENLVEYAVAEGWFVVLPQALPEDPVAMVGSTRWNSIYPDPRRFNPDAPDDLVFVSGLWTALAERVAIDLERLYLAGFSGGGTFSQLVAATRPERVAAVAVTGASAATYVEDTSDPSLEPLLIRLPEPTGAVPAFIAHGSKEEEGETKRPYAGGLNDNSVPGGRTTSVSPVWDQVEYWRRANDCRKGPTVSLYPELDAMPPGEWDRGRARIEHYQKCKAKRALKGSGRRNETEVEFVTAIGPKHTWVKLGNWAIDGDRLIMEFFARH